MSETSQLPPVNKMAPAFSLLNQEGEKVSLKDFKGKKNVVLYFYPKAMTPGCTTQAQCLRDAKSSLTKLDTVVLGVSPDPVERLQKFKEKEKINFDLLADPDHEVSELYGVWGKKKLYGKEFMGIHRMTFIIGKDGKIKMIMEKVKPATHHDEVLQFIKENL